MCILELFLVPSPWYLRLYEVNGIRERHRKGQEVVLNCFVVKTGLGTWEEDSLGAERLLTSEISSLTIKEKKLLRVLKFD